MTNHPYGEYEPPQYPGTYPPNQPYPPSQPYPAGQPYPGGQYYPPDQAAPSDPYAPPGQGHPTAPVPPGHGGGQYGGGQYGGGQYGGYGEQPPGWPPSAPPAPPRRRRTGLMIGLVAGGLALVLCLGGIAVVAMQVLDDPELDPDPDPPVVSTDPFAASPAAGFAEGAAGIQMPAAEAVGDFSADEVEDTLAKVEEALVAARLDDTMLVEHDADPFLALLSEDNQPAVQEDFDTANFSYFASQFAGGAELAATARVEGEVSYEATLDEGGFRVIEVVTSFVWAYAFVVPGDNPDLDGIVVVRDELVWQVAHQDDVAGTSLGLWLWDGEAYAWGIDCAVFEDGLLSPQTELGPGSGGPDDPDEIFDPSGSLDVPDTC